MNSIDFRECINFLLTFYEPIDPDDQPAMECFARIGIAPGKVHRQQTGPGDSEDYAGGG